MTFSKYLKGFVYGFKSEERGSIAVEAVVILPMMFWTYLALFSTFHSYRAYSINQKAAYTVGDMISRETNAIDDQYMIGAHDLLSYLTNTANSKAAVRVTQVQWDEDSGVYQREWSTAQGYKPSASSAQVAGWHDQLPIMPDGERIVVVETFVQYDPPFNTGLEQREVRNFVFTKPRYAPQVVYSGTNGSVSY